MTSMRCGQPHRIETAAGREAERLAFREREALGLGLEAAPHAVVLRRAHRVGLGHLCVAVGAVALGELVVGGAQH